VPVSETNRDYDACSDVRRARLVIRFVIVMSAHGKISDPRRRSCPRSGISDVDWTSCWRGSHFGVIPCNKTWTHRATCRRWRDARFTADQFNRAVADYLGADEV
jgi:hypothetical protein